MSGEREEIGDISGYSPYEKLTLIKDALENGSRHSCQIPKVAAETLKTVSADHRINPNLRAGIENYHSFYQEALHQTDYPDDPEKADWTENLVIQTLESLHK